MKFKKEEPVLTAAEEAAMNARTDRNDAVTIQANCPKCGDFEALVRNIKPGESVADWANAVVVRAVVTVHGVLDLLCECKPTFTVVFKTDAEVKVNEDGNATGV